MRTLLILGRAPLPTQLRDVVQRGSTSVEEKRPSDLSGRSPGDVDRIVVWAAPGDHDVANLARAYSSSPAVEHKEMLLVISPDPQISIPGVAANDIFIWPRDEDRLKMAFMTGA